MSQEVVIRSIRAGIDNGLTCFYTMDHTKLELRGHTPCIGTIYKVESNIVVWI